jgi:hypothetical protein
MAGATEETTANTAAIAPIITVPTQGCRLECLAATQPRPPGFRTEGPRAAKAKSKGYETLAKYPASHSAADARAGAMADAVEIPRRDSGWNLPPQRNSVLVLGL